jgi:hypothetical protein
VSIIHFKVEDVVHNLKGDIETLVPNYRDVIRTIQKELLEPVVNGTNKEATTQTTPPPAISPVHRFEDMHDPLRIGQPRIGTVAGVVRNRYACLIVRAWHGMHLQSSKSLATMQGTAGQLLVGMMGLY